MRQARRRIPLLDRRGVGFCYFHIQRDPELIADQSVVEALIDRAAVLDPDFDDGAIQQFLISYEPARPGSGKDYEARALLHFNRALEITHGQMAGPYVSYAESISIASQNRAQFETLLHRALAIDPDSKLEWRLANLVLQRRARWLLTQEDDLFVDPVDPAADGGSSSLTTN